MELIWNGKGLPPVGMTCEQQTWVNRESRKVEIVAHFNGFAVCGWDEEGGPQVELAPPGDLRVFKTPEQISAEQHAANVSALMHDAGITGSAFADDPEALAWAEALLASGWVKPCER